MAEAGQLAGADGDYSIKDLSHSNRKLCELFLGKYSGCERVVANAQPGLYSYHGVINTAVCSVGTTKVITSVYCYWMPTLLHCSYFHNQSIVVQ